MGSIDNGTQRITYDFKEEIVSEGFNKLNYKLHPKGIYEGGTFTRVSDTQITVAPFISVFEDNTATMNVRIETQDDATVTVSNTDIYVIARFSWLNTENNFMDIIAVPFLSITENDLILGRLQYSGIVLSTTFDYSRKSWVYTKFYDMYLDTPPLKVIPTFPYSNAVRVLSSNGKFLHNGKLISIAEQNSPSFSFPVSTYGRKDVVGISSTTGNVNIITGSSSSNALPTIPDYVLPIAIVTFPASTLSTVKGTYITYLHPFFNKGSNLFNQNISDRIRTVSGLVNGLDGDTLDTHHASYYLDKMHEMATALGTTISV